MQTTPDITEHLHAISTLPVDLVVTRSQLDRDLLAMVAGGATARTLSRNAIAYADHQFGGQFRLGGAGYPADGSKPMNMWTEKGLTGYQVYVHDPHFGGVSVIEDTAGKPVRIKWL